MFWQSLRSGIVRTRVLRASSRARRERVGAKRPEIMTFREGMFMKAYERSAFFAHTLIRKHDLPGPVLLLRYEPAVLPVSGAEHWAWERQLGLKYSLAGSRTGAFAGSGAGARGDSGSCVGGRILGIQSA